ncbi:MAG TPA: hypothetical protein VG269_08530 [Tepidisphaeraceae bacterium]|jgi:hypothetical protein|nr:hypothetical protein [Tepidisphaeraceae bacterium]
MISITCTQCQTLLTIDDAFAGGVCRCQHCGTIQTVPAHLKNNGSAPAPSAPTSSKALYQNKARASGSAAPQGGPRELDDLAQAVASSGLSNSGLGGSGSGLSNSGFHAATSRPSLRSAGPVQPAAPAQTPPQEQRERKSVPLVPLLVIGGAIFVVLIGVCVFLAMRGGSGPTSTTGGGGGSGTSVTAGPNLCGVSITAPTVVYVIDRGNATANVFDPLKAAVYRSLESLGPDRKFQVLFWNNGGDDVAYPADATANATPEEIEKCKRALQDLVGADNSHLRSALDKAMARQPGAIVIATGKDRLDDDDERALANAQEAAAGGKTKFYTFSIGSSDNPLLKIAASATGGQYRQVTEAELRAAP